MRAVIQEQRRREKIEDRLSGRLTCWGVAAEESSHLVHHDWQQHDDS